ncbi:CLUMA_CG008222, isoform A [Clunio marinus]|uniref:CLUMA_CG008222, isoform A n=1 Tax=Clunio marinus TaxID=568069 RepID=A0A1J1I4N0_9DIPT|nr:CLUMA_CG008222, isoform A [Clunio marinus]
MFPYNKRGEKNMKSGQLEKRKFGMCQLMWQLKKLPLDEILRFSSFILLRGGGDDILIGFYYTWLS